MWLECEHQPFLGEEHCMTRQKQLCGILTEALSCNKSCILLNKRMSRGSKALKALKKHQVYVKQSNEGSL